MFEGAAAEAMLEGDEDKARELIGAAIAKAAAAPGTKGRVLLVGAGPGDPELLTMKAVRALKAADVIFYDRLVGEGVLDHARREAELIPVGKAKGAHSVPQEEINALLIERALAGEIVVRLKGGDPFIFGRGGEELDALREAGIEIEIVPGVTAGIAAAASLQIPLTHRDVSHTVTFVSGHEAGGAEPSFEHLDLAALASGNNTLLVYMGVTTAGVIAKKLLEAGFRPGLPVIAVENASREDERRVRATIAELAENSCAPRAQEPCGADLRRDRGACPPRGVVETILSLEEVKRLYA